MQPRGLLWPEKGNKMAERRDNYQIQAAQAKKRFLTYDQQELIRRCRLRFDEQYLYTVFLADPYRINRQTGDMERFCGGVWIDGNSFGEVMTILDWLCDSRADRYITGRWVTMATLGNSVHTNLQENTGDANAQLFDAEVDSFMNACEALGGEKKTCADVAYAIELLDGLRILVKLWHADEEFFSQLQFMWDENATRYIRYETTWYATGLLINRIKEKMKA